MPSNRPLLRLDDIQENIGRIRTYCSDMTYEAFLADTLTQDAVKHCLLRISEAAIKLGDFAEREIPKVPWPSIRGTGNVLRHLYDQVELEKIWKIVCEELPPLNEAIANYKSRGIGA